MTLDDLEEEIERSMEDSQQTRANAVKAGHLDTASFHEGKSTAYMICLEKLRQYRLSSGAEYK